MLALLALRHGEWLSTDAIADELWQTGLPRTWKNSTQRFIADLRQALGDDRGSLESATGRYRLSLAPSQLDIVETAHHVEAGQRFLLTGRFESAKHELAGALSLYAGEVLSDVIDTPSIDHARLGLEETRLEALESYWHARVELGECRAASPVLSELVARHPFRDRLRALSMVNLCRSGRQRDALIEFQDFRRLLAEHSGLEPSSELRNLETQILEQVTPDLPRPTTKSPRPLTVLTAPPPPAPTPPIGRNDETRALEGLVSAHQVVCVTGPAGVGKSTLVEFLVQRTDLLFTHGVTWCDLRENSEEIASVVLARFRATSLEMLGVLLQDERSLLVLDNAEHMADEAYRFARLLALTCPKLTVILATRKRPKDCLDHFTLALSPLALPRNELFATVARSPAVKLYLTAGATAGSALSLTEQNAAAIARICRSLDGLPLALKLAARRPDTMETPYRQRSGALLQAPGDDTLLARTDLLEPLHDTIARSLTALESNTRAALLRLCALPPTFTQQAAVAVVSAAVHDAADVKRTLDALVDASLLNHQERLGQHSYSVLQIIREHCVDQLDSHPASLTREVVREHATQFALDLLHSGRAAWSVESLQSIHSEFPLLVQAIRQAISQGDVDTTALLLIAIAPGLQAEAALVADLGMAFLERWPIQSGDLWPEAISIGASANLEIGRYDVAEDLAERSIDTAIPTVGGCFGRQVLSRLLLAEGKPDLALVEIDTAIEVLEATPQAIFAGEMQVIRASALNELGRHAEARQAIEGLSESLRDDLDFRRPMTETMAGYLWLSQDVQRAKAHLQHALEVADELDNPLNLSPIHSYLAIASLLTADKGSARVELRRALATCVELSNYASLWGVVFLVGVWAKRHTTDEQALGQQLVHAACATQTVPPTVVRYQRLLGPIAHEQGPIMEVGPAVELSKRVLDAI